MLNSKETTDSSKSSLTTDAASISSNKSSSPLHRVLPLVISLIVFLLILVRIFEPQIYSPLVSFLTKTDDRIIIALLGSAFFIIISSIYFIAPSNLLSLSFVIFRELLLTSPLSFQAIDKERKQDSDFQLKQYVERFEELNETLLEQGEERALAKFDVKLKFCASQQALFTKITEGLTEQIRLFDEKASLMLDNGINNARIGVAFLITSVIFWQVFLVFINEVDSRHYIGMGSCSLIFIFMQALAAWCLKQHRAYVDASLYVTKIRSIFERKMQAYLLIKEHADDKDAYHKLLDNFLEDISWPPEPLSAKQQTSYTKEAAETLTEVTKALRVLQPVQGKSPRPSRRHSSTYSRN